MTHKIRNKKGFTLVELIVIIVIILVLTALIVPSVNKYIQQAKKATCANQRHELKTQFQLAAADYLDLAEAKDTLELNGILGGKTITEYLAENGYVSKSTVVCPVYDVEYEIDLANIDGYQEVEFICPCTDSVKGYLALSNRLYGDNKYGSREAIISDILKERGSFLKVADSTMKNSVFNGKDLYWRPYYLKGSKTEDDKVILYASTKTSSNAWENWQGYLIYVDGKTYESKSVDSNGKPVNINIADLHSKKPSELEQYLADKGFVELP